MTATAASAIDRLNSVVMGKTRCGFCNTDNHQKCCRGIRQGRSGVWVCPCSATKTCGQIQCLNCRITRRDEINHKTWLCVDQAECELRIRERLAANTDYQVMKQVRERAMADTKAAKTEKAAKVEKSGTCLVTGKPTKGGLFLPGMDARYVSLLVKDVMDKGTATAEKAARTKMNKDGVSDKLKAKFEKGLGLAREAAEKREKADAEKAEAKKAAKAEKASKAAEKEKATADA